MMKRARKGQEGSALLLSTIISLVVMGIGGAYLVVTQFTQRNTTNAMFGAQALYAAEAGASAYISALNANVKDAKYPRPNTLTFPTSYNRAAYSIAESDTVFAGFKTLTVTGTFAGVTRRIQVVLTNNPGGVYWNAIFAGNKPPNGDPADPYTLSLSGNGPAVDKVLGDIYSGGDFKAGNGALLADETGVVGKSTVMSAGTADTSTLANYTNGSQENLLLPRDLTDRSIWEQKAELLRTGTRMDTDGTTFIDVKHDLTTKGSKGTWGADNSTATQIVKTDEPAHIFRMDPTSSYGSTNNRTSAYEYTPPAPGRNDFYIEDPTVGKLNTNSLSVPINGDSSATSINVQANGNNAVYFVDGNLRVSGEPVKSYQFKSTNGTPLSMTMVVKGNISLTDNILYQTYMSKSDGVAFIAITDPDYPNVQADAFQQGGSASLTKASGLTVDQFVTDFNTRAAKAGNDSSGQPKIKQLDFSANPGDYERAAQEYNKAYGSGNVFFGDPGSGTVEHFEGFMYAENNFYATNLDSTKASGGTQNIEIWGNMTAGNQVKIVRDTTKAGYIPLKVTFDPLIKGGASGKPPPALPSTPGFAESEYGIASWKQVP